MLKEHQKFAYVLAQLTFVGVIAFPLIAIATWLFWDQLAPLASGNLEHVFNLSGLTMGERWLGFAVSIVGAVVQAYGLLGLRQTFREASLGNTFSLQAIQGFRRFAWVTLIMVFVGVAQRTALIIIFSLSDPAHQGRLEIQFGSGELKSLFIGLMLVFVARIFAEGKRAKDENETFL